MKRPLESTEEILKRYLPRPSQEIMEANGDRILEHLRSQKAHPQTPDYERSSDGLWRLTPMRIAAYLIAVAVVSALSYRTFVSPNNVYAIVETTDGSLYRMTAGTVQVANVGDKIGAGNPVRTENGGGAVLRLPDGSRIEMYPKSELLLEHVEDGTRIRLNDGSVNVTPAKEPGGKLYVQNKEQTVAVGGALFQSAGAVQSIQASEPRLAFEEASIRPSGPAPSLTGARGGGGTVATCTDNGPLGIGSVVQIDPGRFIASRMSVYTLIAWAYGKNCGDMVHGDLISAGPGWIKSERFDIQALIPKGTPTYTPEQLAKGAAPELHLMLRALLAQRFKLTLRPVMKDVSAYALMLGEGPLKIRESQPGAIKQNGLVGKQEPNGQVVVTWSARKVSMTEAASAFASHFNKPVLDKTGLVGGFSFNFIYPPGDTESSAILEAVQNQLGLKLEPTEASMEMLVIDHVERPSAN